MFEFSAVIIIACGMSVATISGRTVTDVCWGQELGLGVVARELFVEHIRSLIMGQSHYYWWHVAILLHGSKHHCTTEKPACQPCLPVSQPASNSPSEHTTHHTPNIRIQPTLKHSSPISTSNTHYPSRRSRHSLIIIQLIDQWSMYGPMGVMVRDLE